jgi:electron transport complex protein RnfC
MAVRKTFKGGVHPHEYKELACSCATVEMPAPSRVVVPLRQHLGAPARAVVNVGDRVVEGQVVGEPVGFVSAPVHASISGEVTAVARHRHPGGFICDAVIIEAKNGQTESGDSVAEGAVVPVRLAGAVRDYMNAEPGHLKGLIRDAGIVGMGGAAFPTHVKLSPPGDKPVDTLIINGAECEPYLTCDHRIMLEETCKVVDGVRIMMRILGVSRALIGIEDNKPDAIEVLTKAFADVPGVQVVALQVKYPQGGEKQLIKALTGREVPPPPGLPLDVGCVVQNVGTAVHVAAAVMDGIPFISRVITLSGSQIVNPCNVRVRVGTLLSDVVAFAGGLKSDVSRVIQGGPMMGVAMADLDVPVVKGTSGFVFMEAGAKADYEAAACLRCGRCVGVCPLGLQPAEIAKRIEAGDLEGAEALHVMECMECGSCSFICPSNRWLVQLIRIAKGQINERRRKA